MSDKDETKDKNKVIPITKNMAQLVALNSILQSRAEIAAYLGKSFGGDRDIYQALGYKRELTFGDYWARYSRQDVARRIVEGPVHAVWRRQPEIHEGSKADEQESEFEKRWKRLVRELSIFHYLSRVDVLSGVGQYAVLLLGLPGDLNTPAPRTTALQYLRPFSQQSATVKSWVTNRFSERYGLPESYTIQFRAVETNSLSTKEVHWSRLLHVAEGLLSDDVYGTPRLRPVFNLLQSLELVVGGSGEMFWRGAFPGLGIKTEKDYSADWGDTEKDSLEEELEAYIHGLQRYIRLEGLDIKELTAQVSDPSKHVGVLLDLIAGATSIPKRILIGSERGELASSQDETNWNSRIDERRRNYAEPMILRPFIDRLIQLGVLPQPQAGYVIDWPPIFIPSEEQQAKTAETRAKALATYANAPGADMILPVTMFLKLVLGLTDEQVKEASALLEGEFNEE
jgi:hypothetical protein